MISVGSGLMLFTAYQEYSKDSVYGVYDYIDYIVFFGSLIPLYGYAYKRHIFKRWLWLLLSALIIWSQWLRLVVYIFLGDSASLNYSEQAVGMVLVLPMFIAVILYTYGWSKHENHERA